MCVRNYVPESSCSITLFFLKSVENIEAKELEGEKGGVIVDTLDSGDILQSIEEWGATNKIKI